MKVSLTYLGEFRVKILKSGVQFFCFNGMCAQMILERDRGTGAPPPHSTIDQIRRFDHVVRTKDISR